MAISDYLMTRLGLAQQARGLAAQTEQARAQREAAQNRQNMAYLNALLQTGAQIPGMIGDIGAAQGAAGIQEATTGLEAGEIGEAAAALEAGEIGEAAAAALPAGMGAANTLTGAQTAVPPDQLLETPPGTATEIKRIEAGGPEDDPLSLPGNLQLPKPNLSYERPAPKFGGERILSTPFEPTLETPTDTEPVPEGEQAEDVTYSINDTIQRRLDQAKKASARAAAQKFTPAVPGGSVATDPELEGTFDISSIAQTTMVPTGVRRPEIDTRELADIIKSFPRGVAPTATPEQLQNITPTPGQQEDGLSPAAIEDVRSRGVAGADMKNIGSEIPQQVYSPRLMSIPGMGGLAIPVQEVTRTVPTAEPVADVLPSVKQEIPPEVRQQIKEVATQQDPFEKAQSEFIKKLNSYKPPKYKVPVNDAADKIVEDTWKNKQPNAILNFLSFGQYNNNLENAKRIAKKMVASEINGLRKQEGEAMRKQFIETAKLEAQQLAILQKKINADSKAELKVKLKSLNPEKAVEKLQDYTEVDRAINMFEDATRNMIASGAKFPGGAKYNKVLADLKAFTAKPDRAKGAALNASLIAAGAGGSANLGAETVNIDALQEAVQSLQNADMEDASKDFLTQQMLLAQTIGKAKEGGRMTDADLRFYLDNLFVSNANNPSTLLKSINRLKKVNANSQNDWLNIYQTLYPEIGLPFSALAGEGFTDEDLAAADKLGFYDVLGGAGTAVGRARRQESMGSVVGGGISAIRSALPPPPQTTGAQPPPRKQNKPGAQPPKKW